MEPFLPCLGPPSLLVGSFTIKVEMMMKLEGGEDCMPTEEEGSQSIQASPLGEPIGSRGRGGIEGIGETEEQLTCPK